MGVVYVCRHEALGRRAAVKVLRPELSSNADMVQRFFNEAQAATEIRNPGIVHIFDVGTTPDGRAYFVMELLEGESLGARMKKRRFDDTECCRLGRQIANVLQSAHAAGITHRDLKPDNLFLVPDAEVVGGERVKVLDFGIAKLAGAARANGVRTTSGMMMGTPDYMSPEQCRDASSADARSDIYSLGCILFELACGRPPFVGRGLAEIVGGHIHEPPPLAHNLRPDIPASLSALLAKLLAKQPDARPQTMAAVSQALDEVLRALSAPAVSAPTVVPRTGTPPVGLPAPLPQAALAIALGPLEATSPLPSLNPSPLPAPAPRPGVVLGPLDATTPVPAYNPTPTPAPYVSPNPTPVPAPNFSSTPTTLGGSAGVSTTPSPAGMGRFTYALGGLIVIGAVAAIAAVLANDGDGPAERSVSFTDIADAPRAPDDASSASSEPSAPAGAATVPHPASPPLSPATTAPPEPAPISASDLEAECRGLQVDRKWTELEQCSDKLMPLEPARAAELKTRATEELRSAPLVAGVEAALKAKNLRRAKSELDRIWPSSVDLSATRQKYEAAESQALIELTQQLDLIRDRDCEEYNELVARARGTHPSRLIAEATRLMPCGAPTCIAGTYSEQGRAQYGEKQFAKALASYESAYACNPAPDWAEKAFMSACNLRHLAKSRLHWRRMPKDMRTRSLGICVRNGITAAMLNAP